MRMPIGTLYRENRTRFRRLFRVATRQQRAIGGCFTEYTQEGPVRPPAQSTGLQPCVSMNDARGLKGRQQSAEVFMSGHRGVSPEGLFAGGPSGRSHAWKRVHRAEPLCFARAGFQPAGRKQFRRRHFRTDKQNEIEIANNGHVFDAVQARSAK